MYSIVLLAALNGGPNAPGADATAAPTATAPVMGCTGCCGYSTGCCGGSACYGSSCHGSSCHGGGLFGHKSRGCCGGGGLFSHRSSCCGGGGLFGHKSNCHGCYGSSCYGSSCFGSSCWGSCHGCGGGYVYPMYTTPGTPVVVPPASSTPIPMTPPDSTKKKGAEGSGANLKFRLPADSKLFVDGRLTTGEGTERAFFTPELVPGQKYFYDVKAEITVDGKVLVEERRVIVEAGAEVTESFAKLFAAMGQPVPIVASK